ncbi:MAG: Transcriptional regulatory protein algP, partial [Labilithrix sp.]|nr:Transcriptional regulatory protein algP [Labilithrix sp.]
MSQDTRKDKRAKVVSLNVRYKSATVDEFIENHSHDVSKGGLFVKTPTPFPPGTLLKFEIRLAGDKSVISGVGRVVWKRESTQAGAEKPAGMGVKFIKIDDASRAIIDRLVAQKADAGSAYTSEEPMDEAPGAHNPSTLRGLVAAAVAEPASIGPSPITAPAPTAGGGSKLPVPPPAGGPPPAKLAG